MVNELATICWTTSQIEKHIGKARFEVTTARCTSGCGEQLVSAAIELLAEMAGRPETSLVGQAFSLSGPLPPTACLPWSLALMNGRPAPSILARQACVAGSGGGEGASSLPRDTTRRCSGMHAGAPVGTRGVAASRGRCNRLGSRFVPI